MQELPNSVRLTSGELAGWHWLPKERFDALVGPFYHRFTQDGSVECVFDTADKNANGLDVVHGGALMTFADYCAFVAARAQTGANEVVSISLNTEFMGQVRPGQRVHAYGSVIRAGSSIVFVRGHLRVGDDEVLNFSGVAKVLKQR